nr:EOG090X03A4 [Cyclestheria hislopi]
MRESLLIVILMCLGSVLTHKNSGFFSRKDPPQSGIADRCFCELKGKVDECECSVDYVDQFNNNKLYPRLKSILAKNYFRFFKVNLKKPCPFWHEEQECTMRHCAVQSCTEENMPPGILEGSNISEFGPANDPALQAKDCDHDSELGFLNTTLTNQMSADIAKWTVHDQNQNSFCDIDDEQHNDSVFVDLLLNPERYTGYKGPSAQRIWKAIYEENCFKPKRGYGPYIDSTNVGDLCLEKRAFYRALSGLHTSINIHLCAEYLHGHSASHLLTDSPAASRWGSNLEEFQRRFDPELTNGEGPQRLRNLYFLYLLEMRAIAKASPFLEHFHFYTGPFTIPVF